MADLSGGSMLTCVDNRFTLYQMCWWQCIDVFENCWAILSEDWVQLDEIKSASANIGLDVKQIATRSTEAYIIQVLKHGFLHSDPHSGTLQGKHKLEDGQWCPAFFVSSLDCTSHISHLHPWTCQISCCNTYCNIRKAVREKGSGLANNVWSLGLCLSLRRALQEVG